MTIVNVHAWIAHFLFRSGIRIQRAHAHAHEHFGQLQSTASRVKQPSFYLHRLTGLFRTHLIAPRSELKLAPLWKRRAWFISCLEVRFP